MCLCVNAMRVKVGPHGDQKRASDPLELGPCLVFVGIRQAHGTHTYMEAKRKKKKKTKDNQK